VKSKVHESTAESSKGRKLLRIVDQNLEGGNGWRVAVERLGVAPLEGDWRCHWVSGPSLCNMGVFIIPETRISIETPACVQDREGSLSRRSECLQAVRSDEQQ
jgi:hypothetical protein